MRYPAAEKLEIIRLVEQSHLSVRRTLAKISIPPTTFYRWYDRFVEQGPEGLEDRPSRPSRVWNRKGMKHVRSAPMHPQTQGKIERWHQTLKNRILLENYFFEEELEAAIVAFIDHYNNHRYHESIGNLTPADVYFGRGETILAERRRIKLQTIQNRRLNHQRQAA
jgi:transposase InsO family protein